MYFITHSVVTYVFLLANLFLGSYKILVMFPWEWRTVALPNKLLRHRPCTTITTDRGMPDFSPGITAMFEEVGSQSEYCTITFGHAQT